MNKTSLAHKNQNKNTLYSTKGILQRKCACGNKAISNGECTECGKKKNNLQRKLSIGENNDPLEREADRVADKVMAMSGNSMVRKAPLYIQRSTGQSISEVDIAPSSVDQVLASSGSPLEADLRIDMEQRFGHDFSQVRIHSDTAAEQSATDVNAHAYTVGKNVVFGTGQFSPETHSGKQLIAHELTHVVQQSGSESNDLVQREEKDNASSVNLDSCSTGNKDDLSEEFDCYFQSALILYDGLFEKQVAALVLLRDTAGKDDPPPLWHELIVTSLGIALIAATGGVGSAVAVGVTNKLTKEVANPKSGIGKAFIKVTADMAKDSTKAVIKKILNTADRAVQSASSKYLKDDAERVAKIFFDSQRSALIDAKKEVKLIFVAKKGALKREKHAGILAIKNFAEAIRDQENRAEQTQRNESLSQWLVYQAKGDRGVTKKGGVDLGEIRPRISSSPGVLLLAGDWYREKELKLTKASIDGANSALRPAISNTKIGDLKIPIVVTLRVGEGGYPPFVHYSRNEKNQFFADLRQRRGNMLLGFNVGISGQPKLWGNGKPTQYLNEKEVFKVAKLTFEKMKDKKPPLS